MQFIYLVQAEYDGREYHGWAQQPKLKTVEGTINRILSKIFAQKIVISGASRTDVFVHAYDQHFSFKVEIDISLAKLQNIFDYHFSDDIKLQAKKKIDDQDFDLRANIIEKEYRYLINLKKHDPFRVKYELQYHKPLNLEKLNLALSMFIGRKYFYNFSGLTTDDKKDHYRVINKIEVVDKDHSIWICLTGNGFLRYQIRTIIACALDYCEEKLSLEEIDNYLTPKCLKKYPHPKVPGSGLYLWKIKFNNF